MVKSTFLPVREGANTNWKLHVGQHNSSLLVGKTNDISTQDKCKVYFVLSEPTL